MKDSLTSRQRLIVALDVADSATALSLVRRLAEYVGVFKVGSQLFTAAGPQIVRDIHALGGRVFLDLKFHDIPNTVSGAVKSAVELGVAMFTIHASGGIEMMRAAAEAAASAGEGNEPPLVLGVTVLTSLDAAALESLGLTGSVEERVVTLARVARSAGVAGLVASPAELAALRSAVGDEPVLVSPGVRPVGAEHGDQVRVGTPAGAITAGADYLVVGRPIVQHAHPPEAAMAICAEIEQGLSTRRT